MPLSTRQYRKAKMKTCLTEERRWMVWHGRTDEEKAEMRASAKKYGKVMFNDSDMICPSFYNDFNCYWPVPEHFADLAKPDRVELDIHRDDEGDMVFTDEGGEAQIGDGVGCDNKHYTVVAYRFKDGEIKRDKPFIVRLDNGKLSDTPTEPAVKAICEVLK